MKFAVFLVLCVAAVQATTLATPLSSSPRLRRQIITCEDLPGGLTGLLMKIGNFVTNLLDNQELRNRLTGNPGVSVELLNQLLATMQEMQRANATPDPSILQPVIDTLSFVFDDVIRAAFSAIGVDDDDDDDDDDDEERITAMTCHRSNGPSGLLLGVVVGVLNLSGLTGLFNNGLGPLSGLLTTVIQLLTSLIAILG